MPQVGRIARLVCGRRTKWVVAAVWVVLLVFAAPLAGKIGSVQKNDSAEWLPGNAEATQVFDLQKQFRTADISPAIVVYERQSGITAADQAKAAADARALAAVDGVSSAVTGPLMADDGKALRLVVPVEMGDDGWAKSGPRVEAMRHIVGSGNDGFAVHVTGPVGTAADQANAFGSADAGLMMITFLVVIVILLLAYRSPTLWLLPIAAAGISLLVSQGLIYLLAAHAGLTLNGQSASILIVLVLGAGTDYALLLIARYREELRNHADRHDAMAVAVRRATPAITASAFTIAIGMLCLSFAEMNSTAGLGPVLAIGVAIGLLAMVTLLPALLVICGRWVFWPAKPKAGSTAQVATNRWTRLGNGIGKRPRVVWIGTAVALGALALGTLQLTAAGLSTADSFVNEPDSVVGQQVVGSHFAGGAGQPVIVVGNADSAATLQGIVGGTEGIVEVSAPVVAGGLVSLQGTLRAQPDSEAAQTTVERIRDAVHAVPGAEAKVGGSTALTIDLNAANSHDNRVIIPLVLLVVLLILGLLLRAIVAPLLLMATVVLSFGAALGASTLLFKYAFGFNGTDSAFPLFVFVWLVALGIDYNIFLMTRVKEETQRHGPRRGAITALATTGGVITSAGLVMAGTFAALGTLPLVFFAELGFAVALGVLLDTFVVRSVLVTALNLDVGRWMWWPGKLANKRDDLDGAPRDEKKLPELVG